MNWEQRGNRRYYYRKRRHGDRVISEYVGAGELAEAAANLDALERELRQAERQIREELRALDAQVDEVCDLARSIMFIGSGSSPVPLGYIRMASEPFPVNSRFLHSHQHNLEPKLSNGTGSVGWDLL